GIGDELRSRADFRDRIANEALDLPCSLRASLSELAYFRRDDCESSALLAGTRSFDGGVEREQVRLKRDAVDDADDVFDVLARRRDLIHCLHRAIDGSAALIRLAARIGRDAVYDSSIVGVLLHRRRHLLHARGSLFERRCLLLRALTQVIAARRQL